MPEEYLVNSEGARKWIATFSIQAGRDAYLGKQEDFRGNAVAYNAVTQAGNAAIAAIDVSKRLALDESRTPAARHEAAEIAVNKQAAIIGNSATVLATEAQNAYVQADEMVSEAFKPDPLMQMRDYKLHDYVERLSTQQDGVGKLRSLVEQDIDVARIMFTSKPYLLGFAPAVIDNMKKVAIRSHVAGAQTLYDNCEILASTSVRYAKVIDNMKAALFNRAVANRSRFTRVEV